jgi:hypothetical protein
MRISRSQEVTATAPPQQRKNTLGLTRWCLWPGMTNHAPFPNLPSHIRSLTLGGASRPAQ